MIQHWQGFFICLEEPIIIGKIQLHNVARDGLAESCTGILSPDFYFLGKKVHFLYLKKMHLKIQSECVYSMHQATVLLFKLFDPIQKDLVPKRWAGWGINLKAIGMSVLTVDF